VANKHVIAIDLGAESGRVMQAEFDGEHLSLVEKHRFNNTPVSVRGTLYWDALRQWSYIMTGIKAISPGASSLGVDTWGVDFALLDRDGNLLSNPVHYRDRSSSDEAMQTVFNRVSRREVFERTGIQFMAINGLYRLAALAHHKSPILDAASTFVTIADLFNFWLSGSKICEFSHVTTQQMYNPHAGDWDYEMLAMLNIPTDIFPTIVQPGACIGDFNGIPVIVPATHDTGSAVVAVPTTTKNYAYLSSGTWSLLGLELDEAVINDASYEANLTNEGGAYGTFRLLKNIVGMWLVQQCRVTWEEQGKNYEYAQLASMAQEAHPFLAFIDPDNPVFMPHGDMPTRIRDFCKATNQAVPQTEGEIVRCVYESLAMKYRYVLETLIRVSGREVDRIHIIGGGAKNALLNQMTADATGRVVIAGPTEATAMGNALIQFISLGDIANLAQAREMLSRTADTQMYEPRNTSAWNEQYEKFKTLVATS
jgi:rhamnulokinase